MKNKRIFITGGAGYLGKNLIERLYNDNEIVCYSRDEAKHYLLKKKYPKIKCVVGDIRNLNRLIREAKNCNVGIFTASLKQISACDENTTEAIDTIINGAVNSRIAAEDNNFESACFVSSDKACAATTIYGACKFVAEQSFIVNNSNVPLVSCRYGNVTNSTGSIIPLIKHALENKYKLNLYSEEMTRFMLSINDAINLILDSMQNFSHATVIPNISSFKIKDLFDIYKEKFGLEYSITTPRVGEKIHEVMISEEEAFRTEKHNNYFVISPTKTSSNPVSFINKEFSSRDYIVSKDILESVLSKHNFYL
jgi:UDP-glucose 4-epimerase